MKLEKDDLEAIVVAVLAVNRYSLEKAYALLPAFRKAGLLSPEKVAAKEIETVIAELHAAGYQRGGLMGIMGGRFHSVMQAIHAGKLDTFSSLARKGSPEKATELLCSVKGIGPSVAATVLELIKAGAK